MSKNSSRRDFLKTATTTAALATFTAPFIHASDKTNTKNVIIGKDDFQYEAIHGWGQLPKNIVWGDTHGVTIDKQNFIYIKHRSSAKQPMDAIVVFDPDGKFVRSFGKEFHGGGHGIDIREENGQEFLYLSDTKNRQVVKTDLKGEWLWKIRYPRQENLYKNLKKFNPTNVAFAPDGGFFVGDGYGSSYIHRYDKDAKWINSWGGFGTEAGKMKTPHGLWLDDRDPKNPTLAVCDRANARLQYFTLDGEHIKFLNDFSFPADIDIQGDIMLVPDLHARITLLDKNNQTIVHLGYDETWTKEVLANKFAVRKDPSRWKNGKFIHPHDACFDKAGNIFVTEWVPTGRVSFLKKV